MDETYEFTLTCQVVVSAPTERDARDLLEDVFSGEMEDFGIVITDLTVKD